MATIFSPENLTPKMLKRAQRDCKKCYAHERCQPSEVRGPGQKGRYSLDKGITESWECWLQGSNQWIELSDDPAKNVVLDFSEWTKGQRGILRRRRCETLSCQLSVVARARQNTWDVMDLHCTTLKPGQERAVITRDRQLTKPIGGEARRDIEIWATCFRCAEIFPEGKTPLSPKVIESKEALRDIVR